MTEREHESAASEDEVIVEKDRLIGCRGRVLIALAVLAVLFALLLVMLVRGMLTKTQPQPVKRASADWVTRDVACGDLARHQLNE